MYRERCQTSVTQVAKNVFVPEISDLAQVYCSQVSQAYSPAIFDGFEQFTGIYNPKDLFMADNCSLHLAPPN